MQSLAAGESHGALDNNDDDDGMQAVTSSRKTATTKRPTVYHPGTQAATVACLSATTPHTLV